MDASSAIILFKSELHLLLTEVYDIVMPKSVFLEITAKPYQGSEEYIRLAEANQIQIQDNLKHQEQQGIAGLDKGEYDTIQLYHVGAGNFIFTDDGRAARYCSHQGIPFINALLFPVVLKVARIWDEEFCRKAMDKVIGQGRYSPDVIAFAQVCPKESIEFALP